MDGTQSGSSTDACNVSLPIKILQRSSVPAISKIGHSNSKSKRCFWLAIFVLCTITCSYEIYQFVSRYLEYPVLITLEEHHKLSAAFPAVTVCNLNRVDEEYAKCVERGNDWLHCDEMGSARMLFISETRKILSASQSNNTFRQKLFLKSAAFLNGYTKLDNESRYYYGYSAYQMIEKCAFDSTICDHENFTLFQSLDYGNCYTFNSAKQSKSPVISHSLGSDSGLELELSVNDESYLDITESSAIRVTIHNYDEDPNPSLYGINIPPGYETHITISKISVRRLPSPYRDKCFNYNISSSEMSTKSEVDCVKSCLQKSYMEKCSCVDPLLADSNLTQCSLKNISQLACLKDALDGISSTGLPCKCPLPCINNYFQTQVSSSQLPESNEQRDSFVRLKVYYKSFKHDVYFQKAAYTESELYAHIGSHLSLWLGFSLIVILEYIESLIFFLKYLHKNKRK